MLYVPLFLSVSVCFGIDANVERVSISRMTLITVKENFSLEFRNITNNEVINKQTKNKKGEKILAMVISFRDNFILVFATSLEDQPSLQCKKILPPPQLLVETHHWPSTILYATAINYPGCHSNQLSWMSQPSTILNVTAINYPRCHSPSHS